MYNHDISPGVTPLYSYPDRFSAAQKNSATAADIFEWEKARETVTLTRQVSLGQTSQYEIVFDLQMSDYNEILYYF